MDIRISAKQMDLTDALKSHVEERLGRISKFSDRDFSAEVRLSVEKYRHHIHTSLKLSSSQYESKAEDSSSMYKAIDMCIEKLEKQLRREKIDRHGESKAVKEEMRQKIV